MKKVELFGALVIIIAVLVRAGVYWRQKTVKKRVERQLATEAQKELFRILPILENKLSNWIEMWQGIIPGFTLRSLMIENETTITPHTVMVYNSEEPIEKLRNPLYIYSPDRTKFLDIYRGIELWEENGKIKTGFGPDQGVALVNIPKKELEIILFSGPSGGYDEAVWIDNTSFVITGYSEYFPKNDEERKTFGNRTFYVPTLRIFHLSENKVALYFGPKVDALSLKVWHDNFKEKLANKLGILDEKGLHQNLKVR